MTARTDTAITNLLATNTSQAISAADIRDLWDTTVAKDLRFSVKQFGALGNGVADDSVAIQDCINEASSAAASSAGRGGGWVFIPAGTYMISQRILIENSVTVCGEYGGTMVKMMPGANLAGMFYTSGVDAHTGLRNIMIHGNRAQQSGKVSQGLAITHSSTNAGFGGSSIFAGELQDNQGVFENVVVVGVDGVGIKASGSGASWDNVHVRGTNGHGIETSQNDAQWTNCSVHDCLETGWHTFAGSGRYQNCRASYCGSAGFGFGVGFRMTNGNQSFFGCTTTDTDGAGFLLQGICIILRGCTVRQACNLIGTSTVRGSPRGGGWTGVKCGIELRGSCNFSLIEAHISDNLVGTANEPNLANAVRVSGDGSLVKVGGDPRILSTPGTTPWVQGGTNTTIVHNHNG